MGFALLNIMYLCTNVRERVCENSKGHDRHKCEDNICKECTFVNYFVHDPTISEKKAKKVECRTTFTEEHGVDFLMDMKVHWKEHQLVGVDLPDKRKYDHLIYKQLEGTMEDFLLFFQGLCSKLKPHKFYYHEQKKRKQFSKMIDNAVLKPNVAAIYADYSQNIKKLSGRSGIGQQYRDVPDISLLNLNVFIRRMTLPVRIDFHCVSDDPKHDTSL